MKNDINSRIDEFVTGVKCEDIDSWIRFVERFVEKNEVPVGGLPREEQGLVEQLKKAGLLEYLPPPSEEQQKGIAVAPAPQHNRVRWLKSIAVLRCEPNELLQKLEAKKVNGCEDLGLQPKG